MRTESFCRNILMAACLIVLSLERNAQCLDLELVGSVGGSVASVAVQGNLAYLGEGFHLTVVDVSTPQNIQALGRIRLPDLVEGVAVSGSLVFVADGSAGLQVVDVSNPIQPVLRGSYATPGAARGLGVSGSFVYVACASGVLQILDISDPSSPSLAGSLGILDIVGSVKVVGNFAYVTNGVGGSLRVIDVSNPAAPFERGALGLTGAPLGVAISGSTAYVATSQALEVVDISNPDEPNKLGGYLVQDTVKEQIIGADVVYPYVYVASNNFGMRVLDVSDATHPRSVSNLYLYGATSEVVVSGSLGYFASGFGGISIVDLSNPLRPKRLGTYSVASAGFDLEISDSRAYLANFLSIQILDVADSTNPILLGKNGEGWLSYGLGVSGSIVAFQTGYGNLGFLDVSDPSSPDSFSEYLRQAHPGGSGVVFSGSLIYVVDFFSNFTIIDASNPRLPDRRGHFDSLPGKSFKIALAGSHAYVACKGSAVYVLDISDPDNPTLVSSFDPTSDSNNGGPSGVAVSGKFAYVISRADLGTGISHFGLRIFDISNPVAPVFISSVETAGLPNCVAASGSVVYVGDDSGVVQIFDVSNPESPFVRASSPPLGLPRDVVLSGPLVYVCSLNGGISTLRANPAPGDNNASHVSSSIPKKLFQGQPAPIEITMVNTGELSWTVEGGYSLAVMEDSCTLAPASRIPIEPSAIVKHGESYTFRTTLQSEALSKNCSLQFRMVHEFVEFFGETVSAKTKVSRPPRHPH